MIKLSDYVANFLVSNNISSVFTVTGGGAMHLNDSFGHNKKLNCIYNHHEQASAMAAEAYARIDNRIAAVCVTTGPGATNAITGCICGWMSSIPMLIFSGQARYDTTIHKETELSLRTRGVQEFDIIGSVKNMTKYCELVSDPQRIRYCLEKALYLAKSGRPGPCWLDIPLNVQASFIDENNLEGYQPDFCEQDLKDEALYIIDKIKQSSRPVLFAGNGIRLSGGHALFLELVNKLQIPVVSGMGSVDALENSNPLYIGRTGTTGNRSANFVVQNCDLFISLGSRLSYFTTGFNYEKWAPNAFKIVNDIDINELKKDNINANKIICCDVKALIECLLKILPTSLDKKDEWINYCSNIKDKYQPVLPKHYEDAKPNIYSFYKEMSIRCFDDDVIIGSCGTSRVAGSQACAIKEGMRFITNSSTASMGYDLPASIGTCIARNKKRVILVTGEGSFQMNIQELQTIVQNKLPIIIFIMNNGGYHSIRMTQNSFFGKPLVGVGEESGDLSFPDLNKIASAYGIDYMSCHNMSDMCKTIESALSYYDKPCICEFFLSHNQPTEPKVASKKTSDGKMISGVFEDMAPFLDEKEIEENMKISKDKN